jgi:hypothetical protein
VKTDERNALIERYLPLVDVAIEKLLSFGQPPYIERDDLWQCGAVALTLTLSRRKRDISVKTLERVIRTGAVEEIKRERRRWPSGRVSMEDLLNADGESLV